jgi:hypothetical protein
METGMYMLWRKQNGKFEWQPVNIDDLHLPRKEFGKRKARRILQERGCPSDVLEKIMSENIPGCVMS